LGGGPGGWIQYITDRGLRAAEIALGDSSRLALDYAAGVVPSNVNRYQIDLLQLHWQERWDVAFLLDVLEHIPEHEEALRQIHRALVPGGLLFVTTPALDCFWTWNDEAAHRVRRYSKQEFRRLAATTGFQSLDARYFMFILSPLLLAPRSFARPDLSKLSDEERQGLLAKTHRIPSPIVNALLGAAFSLETPLGHWYRFPWGTSLLAVLEKRS